MNILGVDTETYDGWPMTIQIADKQSCEIIFVNRENVTEKFIAALRKYVNCRDTTAIFCHNYKDFDMGILFFPYWEQLANDEGFKIKGHDWELSGRLTGTPYVQLLLGKKRKILFYDSMSFFQMSLKNLAKALGAGEKLKTPSRLGSKQFKTTDQNFVSYALNDAVIQQAIGEHIFKFHEDYDVQMSLSIAQLAERIFKHQFLNAPWPSLPNNLNYFCLHSYHGGKNGMYVKPGFYKNINYYDIKSAYPWAMYQLPDFDENSGTWYEVQEIVKEHFGIYKIHGEVKDCKYPICFTDNFKKAAGKGEFFLTSPEIISALKHKELKIKSVEGLIFADNHKNEKTSFQSFINHFYNMKKNTSKSNPKYLFYKKILNSLYGKFIQMIKIAGADFDMDEEKFISRKYKVGQMFNPFIASLITGIVRAKMHDLEHKHNSMHTATDSIITTDNIVQGLGQNIGDLELEFHGDALILRNKLYVLFNKKKEVEKYALHGFHGSVDDLLNLHRTGARTYRHNHMTKIKESIIQNQRPFRMIQKTANLNLLSK